MDYRHSYSDSYLHFVYLKSILIQILKLTLMCLELLLQIINLKLK